MLKCCYESGCNFTASKVAYLNAGVSSTYKERGGGSSPNLPEPKITRPPQGEFSHKGLNQVQQ